MNRRKFTDEQALPFIRDKRIRSIAGILRALAVSGQSGTGYKTIHKIVERYSVDTTHWLGFRSRLGTIGNRKPVEQLKMGSYDLKNRLLKFGLKKHQCERCHRRKWLGQAIPLELHHVNGNKRDNRQQNTELLCPNCHALTPNYCYKNAKSRRSPTAEACVSKTQCAGSIPVAATI